MSTNTRRFAASTNGLVWPGGSAACVFGRSGIVAPERKREGDGASPAGEWPMREVFYRPDRQTEPRTQLPVTALTVDLGWCDDPGHALYNQRVALPFPASHEKLWREDRLYDLIVVLGWNDDPVIAGKGSAIFLHVAAPEGTPTEGCVATDVVALGGLLAEARPGDVLAIEGP